MSTTFKAQVEVAAPPEVVWAAVTDWAAQGDWIPGTTVYVVEGDGASAGSRVVAFTGIGDIGFLDTIRIVEWQPPRRCRAEHTGRLLRGEGVFEVQPAGDHSIFSWSERLEPPLGPLGRLWFRLIRPPAELAMRRACRALAARVAAPR